MLKKNKIRGHKRKWKDIRSWVEYSKQLNIKYLKTFQRSYSKIIVSPWCDISLLNSQTPEPKGKTRQEILKGLIEIYDSWQLALNGLNEPYYLKIWLYEPRFSKSQVVCSIGDCLDFYDITFFNPNLNKVLDPRTYGALENEIRKFKWEYRLDEEHINNGELGEPDDYYTQEEFNKEKKWYQNRLKNPHRVIKYEVPFGNATEGYAFKKGVVWIGDKIE